MFTKIFVLLSLTFSILLSSPSGHLKAQTGTDAAQTNTTTASEFTSKSIMKSGELFSAISPSSPPGALIGTATAFTNYWVDVKAGTDSGPSISSKIYWGGLLPGGALPTTCTLALSSPPPGPVQVQLNGATNSTPVTMDSQNLVINKASFPDWFPAGLSTAYFTDAYFWIDGQWFSLSKDMTTAGGYPVLQWSPAALTITYQ